MATVLVIEDGIRNLVETLLSRKGCKVVLASNGLRGLELFRRKRPDFVVLDLEMPEMKGLRVLEQVRQLSPNQPVVILTGARTAEAEQEVRVLGVTEYVEKEYSLHRVGDSLKRLLNSPRRDDDVARVTRT
jgi:DNA-binding NtrC family response regulator